MLAASVFFCRNKLGQSAPRRVVIQGDVERVLGVRLQTFVHGVQKALGVVGVVAPLASRFAREHNYQHAQVTLFDGSFQRVFNVDGGALFLAGRRIILGLAQVDAAGNVNVSKFNGWPVGCGGFINITRSTRKLVFCGSFTAGGLKLAIGDGEVRILKEGSARKFVNQVEQVPFNGHDAPLRQQKVLFVTERAVFRLTPEGLELIAIAPHIDMDRDVLAHMDFRPVIRNVRVMDSALFCEQWGGLKAALGF